MIKHFSKVSEINREIIKLSKLEGCTYVRKYQLIQTALDSPRFPSFPCPPYLYNRMIPNKYETSRLIRINRIFRLYYIPTSFPFNVTYTASLRRKHEMSLASITNSIKT